MINWKADIFASSFCACIVVRKKEGLLYFFVCSGSVGLMEANPTGCQKIQWPVTWAVAAKAGGTCTSFL